MCTIRECAMCGESVDILNDPDGPVWTCPANCDTEWPGWQETPDYTAQLSDSERETAGVWSNCPEDYNEPCPYESVPMHSACYETLFIVVPADQVKAES